VGQSFASQIFFGALEAYRRYQAAGWSVRGASRWTWKRSPRCGPRLSSHLFLVEEGCTLTGRNGAWNYRIAVGKGSMFRYVLKPKASSSIRRLTSRSRPYTAGFSQSCHHNALGLHETRSHGLRCVPTGAHTRLHTGISSLSIDSDTIYALSSAQGRAGIAVIRISGPGCKDVSSHLTHISSVSLTNTKPRYTTHFVPRHPSSNPVTQQSVPFINPPQQI
jgi:hypothetical protein